MMPQVMMFKKDMGSRAMTHLKKGYLDLKVSCLDSEVGIAFSKVYRHLDFKRPSI
jgi:hypothetical protein